ncbi:carbohydrate ABC transporter substrate-binding protein [Clostridium botulinum]|uniref:ABC transporter substrate-binding protein n=1 Tax=Clostridium botulinum TaxID=1491 RepID=UPI001A91726F|nr:ABC transporter substrate-binding protein [Clostridium botulinum]MBO0526127.1 carbohydrate ABC transporter substrate-binding protein [Clostridium botulinum]MBO0530122.1 carbohydrate ABC transporter substrate-binding protein [Clostridium botulinum]MBO0531539.1 carbohydrate ABC transporter substrate-binding protein [Clostridium botulinum]MBO0539112.1 carbohydrate ABC transporter substrate-binding protein [Clostridium botulinum]MBO0543789.1 carbohydrate ABC transporter substrate-binding protei
MKKKKLIYIGIIIILIIPVILVILGRYNNTKNFTKDKLVIWGDVKHNQAMNEGVKDFKEKYPNVEVEFYNKNRENMIDEFSKIKDKNSYPNIICLDDKDTKEFGARYYKDVLILNDLMKNTIKDFIPCKRELVKLYDNFIAVPYTVEPVALYYRKDLLEKYNINSKDIKTWDDFIKIGEEIYKKSNGKVKMISFNKRDNSMLEVLLNEKGIYYFDKNSKLQIDQPNYIDTFNILKRIESANIDFDNKGDFKSFVNNNNVVCIPYNSELSNYLISERKKESGKWEIMKLPSFEVGGKNSAITGGTSIVAIKSCKESKDKLSMELIKNITLNKYSLNKGFLNYGQFPSYKPTYEYAKFSENVNYFNEEKIWRIFVDIASKTPNINYTKNYNYVQKVMIDFKKELLNANDIEKELKSIKIFINSITK